MEPWYFEVRDNFVDAIEEGRIVRVPEAYARREGLLIIRKPQAIIGEQKAKSQEENNLPIADLKKTMYYKKNQNQVLAELIENFQWHISKRRRELGINRKQLAKAINESEYTVKIIENGILPKDDFVIINKLQSFLKINLRKDRKDFSQSPRSLLGETKREEVEKLEEERKTENKGGSKGIFGDEIELIEDEERD